MKSIVLRYGEINLKGKNRSFFERMLMQNILQKIDGYNVQISKIRNRIFLDIEDKDEEVLFEKFKLISGIENISIAQKCNTNYEEIKKKVIEVFDTTKPLFRVTTKRIYKDFEYSSQDFSRLMGGEILRKNDGLAGMGVSLKEFSQEIGIEILNQEVLIFTKYIKGIQGLTPLSSGRGLVLLSGGIDSPVASFLMQARGMNNDFITFLTPYTKTEETVSKITKLAKKLNEFNANDSKLYIVDFSSIQGMIKYYAFENYRIVLLRRAFIRFAEYAAKEIEADALITGESLGQVASQTLEAQSIIGEVSKLIMFKPLIGLNKIEIIKKATMIDTFDISNLPGDDMCSRFTPQNPVIKPKLEKVLKQEEKMEEYEEKILETWKNNTQIVYLGEGEEIKEITEVKKNDF